MRKTAPFLAWLPPASPSVLGSAGIYLCLLQGFVVGCAGNTAPKSLPPQTVTTSGPTEASSAGQSPVLLKPPTPDVPFNPPPNPSPIETKKVEEEKSDDGSLVIIGTGDRVPGVTTRRDLVAAARLERERRKRVQPIAVIDDENLAEQAEGGNVTIANPREAVAGEVEEAGAILDEYADDEVYWQDRARGIRQRWRTAYDAFEELKDSASSLRRRFYAEEDVEFRESDIKPAWTAAKERLREARETIENAQEELDLLYLEGRRAGALEGWLRAGIELEPWNEAGERSRRAKDNPPR